MRMIARWSDEDGSFPTVIYPNARVNRYPSWIAPLGDVLRAADELQPYGFDADLDTTIKRLLDGQDESGGIQTARGFDAQVGGAPSVTPDLRDVLHVAGWCDKAFRYLTNHVGPTVSSRASAPFGIECTFLGQPLQLHETPEVLEVFSPRGVAYRWWKGAAWPEVAGREFGLR